MPRISDRQKLLKDIEKTIKVLAIFGEDDTDDFNELMELRYVLGISRYINLRINYEKNRTMNDFLWRVSDADFRQITRMTKPSFKKLCTLIGSHNIFRGNSNHKQTPVWIQVMVVLTKLGCNGNGNSNGRIARNCGYSNGAVSLFSNRVFTAILSLKRKVIKWPSIEERKKISKRFGSKFGLDNCVGIVDGTHIVFSQKPAVDGEVFFTRKKEYSMNLQLICDDRRVIRYAIIGWPGTVYDSTIFDTSKILKDPKSYLSTEEYLIADSGYTLGPYVCIPYRAPASEHPENKVFNELFSSGRCIIEHVNGILKNRWASLRGIRTQIKCKDDFKKINEHVLCCIILHNLLIRFNDNWEDDDNDDDDDEDNSNGAIENEDGVGLRIRVHNQLLNWYFNQRS
jgi:hypothetical protein